MNSELITRIKLHDLPRQVGVICASEHQIMDVWFRLPLFSHTQIFYININSDVDVVRGLSLDDVVVFADDDQILSADPQVWAAIMPCLQLSRTSHLHDTLKRLELI